MTPAKVEGLVVESSSLDDVTTDQQAAVKELDDFRFEVEEPPADEADLETGCLSCS
jgi:hypothetical protein